MQDDSNQQLLFSKSNTAAQHERLGKLLEKYPYSLNLQYKFLESSLSLGLAIDKAEFKRLSTYAIDKPFFKLKFKKMSKFGVDSNIKSDIPSQNKDISGKKSEENQAAKPNSDTNLIKQNPVKQEVNEQNIMMAPKKENDKRADQAPESIQFNDWLVGLKKSKRIKEEDISASTEFSDSLKVKKKKKKKKKKAKKKYAKYVEFGAKQDEIISETLAELMAKQGYTDKAIEMYNRLSLLFPDKNTYFARKIEDLRK